MLDVSFFYYRPLFNMGNVHWMGYLKKSGSAGGRGEKVTFLGVGGEMDSEYSGLRDLWCRSPKGPLVQKRINTVAVVNIL